MILSLWEGECMDMAKDDLVRMEGIDVLFPGVRALKQCDFSLKAGEVHALVGENGAGKSTLMKVLTGIQTDYLGQIKLEGKDVHFSNIREAQESGISIVHQELNLLSYLTVAQNIFIGRESKNFMVNDKLLNQKTQELFDRLNIDIKPTDIVNNLTVGKLQMVEIARAMSYEGTKILILDEPTAALSEKEATDLFEKVRDLKDKGLGIIFISHRMDELKQIADRITVLRDGEYIGTMEMAECDTAQIIKMMVGRNVTQERKTVNNVQKDAPVVLDVKNFSSPVVHDVSFQLKKGEILGFSGLVGAGRSEVMRLIFGADPKWSGKMEVQGKPVVVRTPNDAVKHGIGYLSEDRKRYGVILGMSVENNIIIGSLDKVVKNGFIQKKACKDEADKLVETMRVKTPNNQQLIKFLSGGNQQKVVIAKWLMIDSDILIFDEPTRGIDVGAKAEIYDLMNSLVKMGKSIIMISSELPEILRMSDRVAVMCEGELTGIMDISEATQEKIMRLATKQDTRGEAI